MQLLRHFNDLHIADPIISALGTFDRNKGLLLIATRYLKKVWQQLRIRRRSKKSIAPFECPQNVDVFEDIREKYGFDGDLLKFFAENKSDLLVHKWHHYIPIYDKYFGAYRNKRFRFLEIGVSKGGSLRMWRQYFGPEAIIFGVDVDPACSAHNGAFAEVRIGSQSDAEFLMRVVEEMGGVDVVLDDGSHRMSDIVFSMRTLFPLLNKNGLYLIEDLHTAYWKKYGGGVGSSRNFFSVMRNVIDDMHRWYHHKPMSEQLISENCAGLHVHDSIVVLEKGVVYPPVHSQIGGHQI